MLRKPEEVRIMSRKLRSKREAVAAGALCILVLSAVAPAARAEECQNQATIDVCRFGCSATEDTCGALCGAAVVTCQGICDATGATCNAGCSICDVACDACCPHEVCPLIAPCFDTLDLCPGDCGSCRSGCSSCHTTCNNTRTSCRDGCQADCDNCTLGCEANCPACVPFRKSGESCVPVFDRCEDGLICQILPSNPGGDAFVCIPSDNDGFVNDEDCLSHYSRSVHQTAINSNSSLNFGYGAALSGVASASLEAGVVYGPDGCYGCYFTECVGAESNIGIEAYGTVGSYISYAAFGGEAIAIVEEVGEGINFLTSQVLNLDGDLIGTASSVSIGVSVLPFSVGVYDCVTLVDTAGCLNGAGELVPVTNSSPVAICDNADVCADAATCVMSASIDNNSTDPDGDTLTLTQSPPGPYGLGTRTVTLTATDPDGASATCTALVTVNDCTPPRITCPSPTTAECEGNDAAAVDPGNAVASDSCTGVTVTDPGTSSYPLGTTTVLYTATDGGGNTVGCNTTVTVIDTTQPEIVCPGDLIVECDGAGNQNALNSWLANTTAADICGEVSLTNDFTALSDDCGATGSAGVSWTAEDGSGNASSCSDIFTIEDTVQPTIVCPADISVSGMGGTDVEFDVLSQDVCDASPVVATDIPTGSFFETGVTTVTATATDECANGNECAFDVIVSCFAVSHAKIETLLRSDHAFGVRPNKVKIRGTFDPGAALNLANDDVTYTIDDGQGHPIVVSIPAGSFEGDDDHGGEEFKFQSHADGVKTKAEFDFVECEFGLDLVGVEGVSDIVGTDLTIRLEAGINVGEDLLQMREKRNRLEFERRPKFRCCDGDSDDESDSITDTSSHESSSDSDEN